MEFIRPFSQISRTETASAGGKGASLGEMSKAGFPIPPGFVITADAYTKFIADHPRRDDIASQLAAVNLDDMNSVDRAANVIRDIIHDFPLPAELEQACLAAFDSLKAEFVAVRSSATAEDSDIASWAGELESYLNTTRESYLQNIKRCWASLFSPRAIFYRLENRLQDAEVQVAVVVQTMVESEVAGVCFTVHPVTKDQNQLIIEAGLGLGEALVSGQITPDSYVIAKDSMTLLDQVVSQQKIQISRGPHGATQTQPLEPAVGGKQKLPAAQVLELAKLCLAIEKHYGFPVDIEWAFAAGHIFITQARPITTLR